MDPRTLVVAVVAAVAATVAQPAAGAQRSPVQYEPPVPGPVVRGFEAPDEPWGSGHRGVDLVASPGEPIAAAAAGRVVFAGSVAGARWVTVAHADGVRTSYGPLVQVRVATGQAVHRGSALGSSASGHHAFELVVHWSARRGDRYLDPLTLIARRRPALVDPGATDALDPPAIPRYDDWDGRSGILGVLGFVEDSPVATGPGWVLPPNPNHVIGVSGLGSTTDTRALDLAHLGYAGEAITYFSYAGRRDGLGPANDPKRDQLPHEGAHTYTGVHAAALRLRTQLRAQHARAPGVAVDLVGHSMGGLVVLDYLLTLHDPADPTLPPIGHVVTLASPIEGADLASAARHAALSPLWAAVLGGMSSATGLPHLGDQAAEDLAVDSRLVQDLARAWERAAADPFAGPLATGTQVLTLGGEIDPVVPEHRSDLPGAPHVVLPGGHDHMRLTEASRITVRAFLADEPVPGEPGGLGHWASYALGWGEQLAGAALGGHGWAPPPS